MGEVRLLLDARRDVLLAGVAGDGLALARDLAGAVDALLAESHRAAGSRGRGLALLALGGYGRGELNPRSDVDLMVLHADGDGARAADLTGPLLAFLWDVGLEVGHSVRSLSECAEAMERDPASATALLEGRLVAGSRVLFRRYVERVVEPYLDAHGDGFIEQKIGEARARHEFYGGSPLLAVPNVKESAGGLRDMHVAGWIGLALSGRKDFRLFREAGLLTRRSTARLLEAYAHVHRIRNVLHLVAGRKLDTLEPAVRGEVAARLGVGPERGFTAEERLLRSYYRAARPLHRFLDRVVRFREGCPARPRRRPLGRGLLRVGGEVYPEAAAGLAAPREALDGVHLMVLKGLRGSPELVEAVARTVSRIDDEVRSDPGVAGTFLSILRHRGAGRGLRVLEEAGFLGGYLPEYGALSCLAVADPHHRYTVDEHSLRAVEALDALALENHPAREEFARFARPDLLRLALLLHDIGKVRGRGHVARGVAMLPEITGRLGLPPDDARLVRFLVEEHLLLPALADRRIPVEGAAELAATVPGRNALRALYLVTLSDVSATGSRAGRGWWEARLRALYDAAMERLDPTPPPSFEARAVAEAGADRAAEVREHLEAMGERYALEVEPASVPLHLDLVRRLGERPAVLSFLPGAEGGEVWVGARDTPGLFAGIAGVLALHGLSVVAARAHTRADGIALDGFTVTAGGAAPPGDEEFWERVTGDVARMAAGELDIEAALAAERRRFRTAEPVRWTDRPPGATASNLVSPRYTAVEVTAADRPALLFDLARTITGHGLSIHHAVVATRADRGLDTFYITRGDGTRPEEDGLGTLLEDLGRVAGEGESP